MLKAVLVDDEEIGSELLAQLIIDHCDNIQVIGHATNINDAHAMISKLKPDLIFLDIEMSGGTGFDLLDKFESIDFKVIFVTAYSHYSLKAIKYSAIDYLMKPVEISDLQNAVNKLNIDKHPYKERYETLLNNLKSPNGQKKIAIPDAKGFTIVEIDNITRCEAKSNYTIVYLLNQTENILSSRSLMEYEDLLKGDFFIRVHHSHIVNLNYISRYEKRDGGILILKDNSEISISRRKKDELFEKMSRTIENKDFKFSS